MNDARLKRKVKATNTRMHAGRRWPGLVVRAILVIALIAVPASAVRRPPKPMPAVMKVKLQKAHAAARAGCIRVAKTATMKRLCGQKAPAVTGVKSTASVVGGYQQYGFVCRYDNASGGSWSAAIASGPDDFVGGTRDFLLWLQFPPGLDQLPGGTYVMTVFAAAYCDVYGSVAYPDGAVNPPAITPDAPTASDACAMAGDTYTIPDAVPVPLFTLFGPDETKVNLQDPDVGIMYLVNGVMTAPGTYRVSSTGTRTILIEAVPTTNRYTVKQPDRWVLRFTDEPCPHEVSPVRPAIVNQVCGPNNDVIGRVESPIGLSYDYGQWQDNTRTVTVTAGDGYVIAGDADGTVSWTYTDHATPCPIAVATRAPTVQELCGPTNDIITVPAIEGVHYTVGDWVADGTLTVTAAADPGYVIAAGSGIAWKVTDAARKCPVIDPPLRRTSLSLTMVGRTVRASNKKVVYGLIIRNTGRTTARNVVIRYKVPAGLSLVGRPVDARIRKGVIVWRIGDLQPGAWVFFDAAMKPIRNRTVRRCSDSRTVADNATTVSARRCTRFLRVAGTHFSGGVTG